MANGMVDHLRTVFFAQGTREEVLGFLTAVTHSIQVLPLDRLEDEKRVLETEAATQAASAYETLFGLRFGASRHGLMNYAELGLRAASAESVVQWAAERFTRENAALWMSGPPPEELELNLNLSAGRPLPPPDPEPLPQLRLPAQASLGNAGGRGRRACGALDSAHDRTLTSEMIAEALAAALETSIFLVPEGLPPPGRISKYGEWDVPRVQGREYRARGSGPSDRARESSPGVTGSASSLRSPTNRSRSSMRTRLQCYVGAEGAGRS